MLRYLDPKVIPDKRIEEDPRPAQRVRRARSTWYLGTLLRERLWT